MSTKQGGWNFTSISGDNQSLLTAFRADDTLVEMIPNFDWPDKLPLVSSASGASFGPFTSGVPTTVPLWLALHLQTKSLCRSLCAPAWLSTENLSQILAFEKKNGPLWPDASRLPANYYEVATRLAPVSADAAAVKLVVTDLLQVRLDKLRQQFSNLLQESSAEAAAAAAAGSGSTTAATPTTALLVSIAGIGTAEVAYLRQTVQQTLNDYQFLQKKQESKAAAASSSGSGSSGTASKSSSSASRVVDDIGDDDEEESSSSTNTAAGTSKSASTPAIVQGRKPIRRFRGSGGRIGGGGGGSKTITPGGT